uniref:Wsv306-like protein n=1 Tax=Metapenaeus joyneri majanivirus TaxID=2984280 RepID=A0A9C7BN71_9VIRU|nr:MAG: wsv306-like protein [Metapenaeus joyneri majanivirus]
MALHFYQLHHKPNCATVDILCTNDKDCHLHCNSSTTHTNSHDTTMDKHEDSTVIINLCNNTTKRCEPNLIRKGFYDMAVDDLRKLIQIEKMIPKAMRDYIKTNDGKRFIAARARFYENLSFHLKEGAILNAAIQRIRDEHKKHRKNYYLHRLQEINKTTKEDDDNNNNINNNNNNNNNNIDTSLYMKQLFGHTAVLPENKNNTTLVRDLEYDKKRGEYCNLVATNAPTTTSLSKKKTNKNSKLFLNSSSSPPLSSSSSSSSSPLQFHCNEEMNAGIMMAAYRDDDGNILPICVCTYPYYLTGPTCKHRTYNRVVDYDLWEKNGYPDFLIDPFNDYTKANNICKSKTINTTAVFDERDGCFYCQPLAAHFAQSLQMRGPYEPALILDKDYIDSLNRNQRFKINIDYLDLLGKFY